MRRTSLALAALLGCLAVSTGGCSSSRERGVRAPKSGVKLRYALEVGTSFDGHLRIGTTRKVEGLSAPLTQSVECDARLFVVKADEDGARVVRATFRSIELDWSVPPETGLSTEAFAKLAATTLKETEMRFSVSPRGKVVVLPGGPERVPPELEGLLDTLGRAATLGFTEVPERAVGPGDTWVDEPAVPGARRSRTRLDGLGRRGKTGPTLARLEVSFTSAKEVATPSGTRRRQVEGETQLRLSEHGVPTQLHTELRDFDPVRGTAVQEVHAQWSRTDAGDRGATDVQDIDDPCDPDYVGTATCPNA
ncbi:MAG: hypothetical protein ACE37F_12985 [Nannocystaceae bacterium]|nr:hypothetical protein [bacterium]